MDASHARGKAAALRAYVAGDSSEPIVISAFRGTTAQERSELVMRHRAELAAIDGARLVILESMLLPLEQRQG